MSSSRSFGGETPVRTNLVTGGGKKGELGNLRSDVDRAFTRLEEDVDTLTATLGLSAPTAIWVDGVAGDDANAGTEAAPLKTLDAALTIVGTTVVSDVDVNLLPAGAVEGYDSELLWQARNYVGGRLTLRGVGDTDQVTGLALTANATTNTYDFSGLAPGWTPGEFSGYALEYVSGSSADMAGQKRIIIWNTADTIYTAYVHYAGPPSWVQPQAGDVFKINLPSVAIKVLPDFEERKTLYGGRNSTDIANHRLELRNCLVLENLEFRVPDGLPVTAGRDIMYSHGAIQAFGVHFTKNTASVLGWSHSGGMLSTGCYIEYQSGHPLALTKQWQGWGFSARDRGGNDVRPELRIVRCNAELSWVGGTLWCLEGADVYIDSGFFDALGRTAYPHGSIYSRFSHVWTRSSSGQTIWSRGVNSERHIETEFGWVEMYRPFVVMGGMELARARHHGQITFARDIVSFEAGTNHLRTLYGGQIRLTGHNGAGMGDAIAGTVAPVTRPAAVWAINDIVNGSEGSSIYRTS